MDELDDPSAEWAIVELFGHILTAGRATEVERYGGKMMRLDIPGPAGEFVATQFIGHSSLFRVTITTEDAARQFAVVDTPQPRRWHPAALEPGEGDAWRAQSEPLY